MTLMKLLTVAIATFSWNVCDAVVCEGTAADDCNGILGSCTDTGLCSVNGDMTCVSVESDDCGMIGITGMYESLIVNLTVTSDISTVTAVTYDCDFVNRWSGATHPTDYPSSAHWSPMVIAAHSDNYQMWKPGMEATPGVEVVAETGATSTIKDELDAAGSDIGSTATGTAQFNSNKQMQTIEGIKVDASHPYVSAITMIAPSPDWFTGFYDFQPATDDGFWYERFVIDTMPFDAGTDSGTTYRSSNVITNPQVPIFQLTTETVPDSGVLLSPDGTTIFPVATWDCTLVDADNDGGSAAPSAIGLYWLSLAWTAAVGFSLFL